MGEQLRLAGITVNRHFPDECSAVLGHAIQLEQVILNLLRNAQQALEKTEEKKIEIRLSETANVLTISVNDTGGGIEEENMQRVFEPFFTTKEMGKGTGLGMSVSYGIINDMGGTITAGNLGKGALFLIKLPVAVISNNNQEALENF